MDDEIDFAEYFQMAKKNFILIIVLFILLFSLSAYYIVHLKPVYEGTSLVALSTQDPVSAVLGQPSTLKLDPETQRQIILSSSVLGPVDDIYDADFDLTVTSIKNSNVIEITVNSRSPIQASKIANSIAFSYLDYTIERRREQATAAYDFLENQLAFSNAEILALNQQIVAYADRNLTGDEKVRYQKLQQELSAKEKIYNSLLAKKEEVEVVAQGQFSDVSIIEEAEPSLIPVSPNKPMYLLLAFVFSALFSFGAAFAKESISDAIKSPKDAEKIFRKKAMGVIPYNKGVTYLHQHSDKQSHFSEAMRSLRTKVLFYAKESGKKAIAVTSPQNGDGKTTIAVNLAVSLSQAGKKVLLIDANFRNSTIDSIFDKSGKGLSDVLIGAANLNEVIVKAKSTGTNQGIASLVSKDEETVLKIITAGKSRRYPSELLSSHKLDNILKKLSGDFDIVLIDAPSLLRPETPILCSHVDASIIVAAKDRTLKENALRGLHALHNAEVAGVVFNFSK